MCSSWPGNLAGDVHARRLRDQDDRPHARRGKFDQADLAEARPLAREQRLEHLLEAAIDRAHHRHAAEQPFAEIDQRPPDQVGGEETEQRQRDHGDDQARAGQSERQIGFRPVGRRHERTDDAVDPVHEPPGQVKRDRDRPCDNQSGQKIVPETGHQPGMVRVQQGFLRGRGRGQFFAVHRGSRSEQPNSTFRARSDAKPGSTFADRAYPS